MGLGLGLGLVLAAPTVSEVGEEGWLRARMTRQRFPPRRCRPVVSEEQHVIPNRNQVPQGPEGPEMQHGLGGEPRSGGLR